jgi:hypothetical protein
MSLRPDGLLELGAPPDAAEAPRVSLIHPPQISIRAWLEPKLLEQLGRHRIRQCFSSISIVGQREAR